MGHGREWTVLCLAVVVWAAPSLLLAQRSPAVDFVDLDRVVAQELRQTRTPGAAVAVVMGERVVFAKGFGLANVETEQPVAPEMLFRLGSTTKMFTAAALVQFADDGKLTMSDPIGGCVPGLHSSIAALTPHQLLTHTAGLTDESVMSGYHDESALAAGVRAIDDRWLFTEPGRLHSYANPGYWIAGLACEQIAGKPYADVLEDRLFRPLKMSRTTLRPLVAMTWPLALGHEVRNGAPQIVRPQADNTATWPAGQMYSNVEELARFTIAFLHDGRIDGEQVLSPSVIRQLSEPYIPRPGSGDYYGYGLVIGTHRGVKILSHGGSRTGYGSTIRMAPDHKVAVIILTNRSASSLPRSATKALDLALALSPQEREPAEEPQPLGEDELGGLIGVYTNRRQTLELFAHEGRLHLRRSTTSEPARAPVPVSKLGTDRLVYAPSGNDAGDSPRSTLFIVRDDNGNPEYLCSGSRALKRQPTP
jgi:CubicO group peptidase (beta-lactamase class C family)